MSNFQVNVNDERQESSDLPRRSRICLAQAGFKLQQLLNAFAADVRR
jgi:hypothetical protein